MYSLTRAAKWQSYLVVCFYYIHMLKIFLNTIDIVLFDFEVKRERKQNLLTSGSKKRGKMEKRPPRFELGSATVGPIP